jgi:hypothetical protein
VCAAMMEIGFPAYELWMSIFDSGSFSLFLSHLQSLLIPERIEAYLPMFPHSKSDQCRAISGQKVSAAGDARLRPRVCLLDLLEARFEEELSRGVHGMESYTANTNALVRNGHFREPQLACAVERTRRRSIHEGQQVLAQFVIESRHLESR